MQSTKLSQLPSRIAIGRSAEIFPWGEGKVVKLFFSDIPKEDIEFEYKNTLEANKLGVCSMRCYEKIEIENRIGIVLDFIEGVSLTKLPEQNPIKLFEVPKILAELHSKLHKKETGSLREIKSYAKSTLALKPLKFLNVEERKKAEKLIDALPGGSSILHMDFHPENIVVSKDENIVIDWRTAAKGNRAADVAYTVFLFKDAELWPGTPKLKLLFYTIVRSIILRGYLKNYISLSGITLEEIDAWKLPILLLRAGVWDIDSERDSLQKQIRKILSGTK
ncbi:aminoglycoside phosphotransferase family protein [Leptospira sarikeiensis]|uniref:aminoglycoside phosphotransferase family protein n=1 Tax=Leptospira sarikeiensis TaxID=2484943 RepID=UPI00319DC68F